MIYQQNDWSDIIDLKRENELQESDEHAQQQWPEEDTCKSCGTCGEPKLYVFGFAVCEYCDSNRQQAIDDEYHKNRAQGYDKRLAAQMAHKAHDKREWYRHLTDIQPKKGKLLTTF